MRIRHFEGTVVTRGSPDYDQARAGWNGAIDRKPAAVARCRVPGDVPSALRHARDAGLQVTVRGGGHNVAGTAVCDDGHALAPGVALPQGSLYSSVSRGYPTCTLLAVVMTSAILDEVLHWHPEGSDPVRRLIAVLYLCAGGIALKLPRQA